MTSFSLVSSATFSSSSSTLPLELSPPNEPTSPSSARATAMLVSCLTSAMRRSFSFVSWRVRAWTAACCDERLSYAASASEMRRSYASRSGESDVVSAIHGASCSASRSDAADGGGR